MGKVKGYKIEVSSERIVNYEKTIERLERKIKLLEDFHQLKERRILEKYKTTEELRKKIFELEKELYNQSVFKIWFKRRFVWLERFIWYDTI
jgi:prefoldin subunit 5